MYNNHGNSRPAESSFGEMFASGKPVHSVLSIEARGPGSGRHAVFMDGKKIATFKNKDLATKHMKKLRVQNSVGNAAYHNFSVAPEK